MKFINKELGHRLWGMNLVLWVVIVFGDYDPWLKLLSGIVFIYFAWFGADRFKDKNYKKFL